MPQKMHKGNMKGYEPKRDLIIQKKNVSFIGIGLIINLN